MRENYKIFVWDSRNTGLYPFQDFNCSVKKIRDWCFDFAGEHYRIEGENGWFEEYQDGEKVSWSV
jgi:hypothetical protein